MLGSWNTASDAVTVQVPGPVMSSVMPSSPSEQDEPRLTLNVTVGPPIGSGLEEAVVVACSVVDDPTLWFVIGSKVICGFTL